MAHMIKIIAIPAPHVSLVRFRILRARGLGSEDSVRTPLPRLLRPKLLMLDPTLVVVTDFSLSALSGGLSSELTLLSSPDSIMYSLLLENTGEGLSRLPDSELAREVTDWFAYSRATEIVAMPQKIAVLPTRQTPSRTAIDGAAYPRYSAFCRSHWVSKERVVRNAVVCEVGPWQGVELTGWRV